MTDWDTDFRETRNVFGVDPAPMLKRHAALVQTRLPALDVGCGLAEAVFRSREP